MIFAEKRREGGGDGYYTLRWFVWNGHDTLGTYGVHFAPGDRPYSASRDVHRIATQRQIEAREETDAFDKLPDEEQDKHYDAGTDPAYAQQVDGCCYFDYKPCCCDGSGLVETTTDDQRAFEIAAMMADVDRDTLLHPRYAHDCDTCLFIGRVERGEGVWVEGSRYGRAERTITWPTGDLWLCPGGSIIVRTGSYGPEYHSMGMAYFAALPDHWKPMARSIWRHYSKPDDFDYERMRKRRTKRRFDRRLKRRGIDPFEYMMNNLPSMPDGFPDYYEED